MENYLSSVMKQMLFSMILLGKSQTTAFPLLFPMLLVFYSNGKRVYGGVVLVLLYPLMHKNKSQSSDFLR